MIRRRRVPGTRLLGLTAILIGVGLACEQADSYVFTARRLRQESACLDEYGAVAVLSGEGASVRCNARCFRLRDAIYITTLCPPLPTSAEALAEGEPPCELARSLLDAGACGETAKDATDDGPEDARIDQVADSSEDGPSEDASTDGG